MNWESREFSKMIDYDSACKKFKLEMHVLRIDILTYYLALI